MKTNSVFGGAHVKEGEASLNLTADDLYDRIINLKFIRKKGGSFTIRSDYEPVFHNDNTVSFKRCVEKPDIKVSYKQVAESVAIEVDIEITNLLIGDSGQEIAGSMYTAEGDPVQRCIIQMGYRAQFPDWAEPERRNNISQFYDLNNNTITSKAEVRRGRQILVQILTGYPKTYPPDKVTYFKGIIGTMETGLRWNHTADDLVKGYGDDEFPKDQSEMEDVLFQFITRRFVMPSILHYAETEQELTNEEAIEDPDEQNFEQKVMIYRYNDYLNTGSDAAAEFLTTAAETGEPDAEWTELPVTESGIMSVETANRFGVICVVSETLRSMEAHALYGYGLTPEQAKNHPPSIPATPFNDMHNTIGGQLVAIQQHYPFIRWYQLLDGSFFFYHEHDTDKDLYTDPYIKEVQEDSPVFLPAIYDMTPAGTRAIRCPFISFLSPMRTVLFQSRYTPGTLTSFFYTPKTNAFLVITSAVEFATVQDLNTMELMCVDLPPHEVEIDEETGKVVVRAVEAKVPAVVQMQRKRNMQWTEKPLSVVEHRTKATETDSSWENIARIDVLNAARLDRWPEGQVLSEKMALEALKEWNPDYFDEDGPHMALGNSIENNDTGIGGRTGIPVPWLKEGDIIMVRRPFQSEYPEDEKEMA